MRPGDLLYRWAKGCYPSLLHRIHDEGHSIGTHTQDHPLKRRSIERMKREIDDGIESVGRALGGGRPPPPCEPTNRRAAPGTRRRPTQFLYFLRPTSCANSPGLSGVAKGRRNPG